MNKKLLPLAIFAFATMASAQAWFDVSGNGVDPSSSTTRVCSPAVDCTILSPTTGTEDGGYWFDYDDRKNDGGNSETVYPVTANEYGDYVAPMIAATGSISLTMIMRGAAENPFVGYGFNIVNGNKEEYSVTGLGSGICAEIQNDALFNLEMEMPGNGAQTGYNEPIVAVASGPRRIIEYTWDKFKQQSGWGTIMADLSKAVAFKFKLANGTNGMADQTSTLKIWQFGASGTCKGVAIENGFVASSSVKAHLAGRTLSFSGVNAGANVEVINLQGQVMVKSVLNSSVNLSNLDAGVYMVRVSGKAVNFNQKIVLK